jgi:hypothetical protein
MEYVAVCDSEPDVLVTVTVYVPAAVFVLTPQPVMAAVARAAANTTTLTVSNFLSLRFFHPASGRRRSEATTPAIAIGRGARVPESSVLFEARCTAAAAAFTSVAIVRVEVAAAPLRHFRRSNRIHLQHRIMPGQIQRVLGPSRQPLHVVRGLATIWLKVQRQFAEGDRGLRRHRGRVHGR